MSESQPMSDAERRQKIEFLLGWVPIRNEAECKSYFDHFQRLVMPEIFPGGQLYPTLPTKYPVLARTIVGVSGKPLQSSNDRVSGTAPFSFTLYLTVEELAGFAKATGMQLVQTSQTPAAAQNSFNQNMAAHVLSLVSTLIEKKLISADDYRRKHQGNLATVDHWNAQDKERNANIKRAIDGAGTVLGSFYPEPDQASS